MVYPVPIDAQSLARRPVLPPSAPEVSPVSVSEYRDQWVGEDLFSHIDDYSARQNGYTGSRFDKEGLAGMRSIGTMAETIYRQIEEPYQLAVDFLGHNIDIYG